MTGNPHEMSRTTYVEEHGKKTSPEEEKVREDSTKESDLMLDKSLKNIGVEQNTKKRGTIVQFVGRGSMNALRKVQCSSLKVCRSARYLGPQLHHAGAFYPERR